MRKPNPAKQFKAIKNYFAHLRLCAFNDKLDGTTDSDESLIHTYCEALLKKGLFVGLKEKLLERNPVLDYGSPIVAVKIKMLFNAILRIEDFIYGPETGGAVCKETCAPTRLRSQVKAA